MKNPWLELPDAAPRVLQVDRPSIDAFNIRYADIRKYTIQTQLFPEPFIGDPAGRVYLLKLNPGYSPEDDKWHTKAVFADALINNFNHNPAAYPFYFFNPKLASAPGSKWWMRRTRWMIDDLGQQLLSKQIFCVELFPYHSQNFKSIPASIASGNVVPSSNYSAFLVRSAILANKPIVAMRAFTLWCNLVPELETYRNLHRLNSPQNFALSPKNLDGYTRVLRELEAA